MFLRIIILLVVILCSSLCRVIWYAFEKHTGYFSLSSRKGENNVPLCSRTWCRGYCDLLSLWIIMRWRYGGLQSSLLPPSIILSHLYICFLVSRAHQYHCIFPLFEKRLFNRKFSITVYNKGRVSREMFFIMNSSNAGSTTVDYNLLVYIGVRYSQNRVKMCVKIKSQCNFNTKCRKVW